MRFSRAIRLAIVLRDCRSFWIVMVHLSVTDQNVCPLPSNPPKREDHEKRFQKAPHGFAWWAHRPVLEGQVETKIISQAWSSLSAVRSRRFSAMWRGSVDFFLWL